MARSTGDWAFSLPLTVSLIGSKSSNVKRLALGLLLTLAPRSALALQPLSEFLAAAKEANFDNREARVELARLSDETWVAWSRLLPNFDARFVYTRNQYEGLLSLPNGDETYSLLTNPDGTVTLVPNGVGTFTDSVVSAKDQIDGFLELQLPLIDLPNWANIGVAKDLEKAGLARAAATGLEVERSIAKAYFQVLAGLALLEASERTVKSSEENLTFVKQREAAGVAAEVDVKRAVAEVARTRQAVADAQFGVATSTRLLETLTKLAPTPGKPALVADLGPPGPLDAYLTTGEALPSVRAASAEAEAAESRTLAATALLLPTISANAQERFTNAAGFVDSPYYTLSAVARWHFDLGAIPARSSVKRQAEAAQIRAERAAQAAKDAIHSDWHQVQAQRQKAEAARSELEAMTLAAKLVKQRYEAGTAAWLDVILADRDAFSAEVARVRSDADLSFARASLAISSGRGLEGR